MLSLFFLRAGCNNPCDRMRSFGLITVAATLQIACVVEARDTTVWTDTTGAVFDVTCTEAGCQTEPREPLPLPDCLEDEWATHAFFIGKRIEITAACVRDSGWNTILDWARLAKCSTYSDCGDLGGHEYSCIAGLCQNVDTEQFPDHVSPREVELLCLADVPRIETIDPELWGAHILRTTEILAAACGPDHNFDPDVACTLPLPEDCWQPF